MFRKSNLKTRQLPFSERKVPESRQEKMFGRGGRSLTRPDVCASLSASRFVSDMLPKADKINNRMIQAVRVTTLFTVF